MFEPERTNEADDPTRELIRQLRGIKGIVERRPGVFHLGTTQFVQLRDLGSDAAQAEIKKVAASGYDRMPIQTAEQRRRLIDEAKRRAAKLDED